jgi:hypothetical protein
MPLLKLSRTQEAARLFARCVRSFHPERCYYWGYGDFIKWLTLTGNLNRACRFYEQCQRAITPYTDPLTRLHLALDALVLFDRLLATGRQTIALRLPEAVAVSPKDGVYRVEALREWLHGEALELAGRFDRRNGTDYYREQIQERIDLQRWAIPCPTP